MIVELRQFTLLLWKNFTLKKRQWILLIMEFLLELLFTVILLILRNSVSVKHMNALEYAQQSVHTLPSYFLNANTQKDWELVYIPSTSETVKSLVGMVQKTFKKRIKIRGFTSEKDFEEYIKNDKGSDHVMAAVVFDQDFVHSKDPLPLEVRYHLRFSYLLRNTSQPTRLLLIPKEDHGWCTSHLFPVHLSQGPRNPLENDGGAPGYIREGFLAIQHALDKAIIRYHEKEKAAQLFRRIKIYTKRFPFPAFLDDNFLIYLSQIWPPMIILIFSLTVITILHTIVQEKETKLKEYLLIMGLRRWQLWGAAFVTFFLTLSVTISLMTLFLFVKIAKLPIIRYSDPTLVFSFLLLYGIATILFAFMLFTFFSKANTAVTIGSLIYFVSFLPYYVIDPHYNQMSLGAKLISCLLSNVAMTFGMDLLIKFESIETGIQWGNLNKPFSIYGNFAFGHVIVMLLIDTFLYVIVICYVEAVLPGKYGMPRSWFFYVKPDYQNKDLSSFAEQEKNEVIKESNDERFEPEPEHLVAHVQIKNLTKVFKVGNTVKEAVRDLTLNLYEGQITALLGHNGSGKTTTLSMLTDIKYEENYYGFQGHGIGKYVVAMTVTGFLFLILLYIIEVNLWTCKSLCSNFLYGCFLRGRKGVEVNEESLVPEDRDVINERKEVLACFSKKPPSLKRPLILKELLKIYFQCAPIVAVDRLTFAVQEGECFGLFGSNGAGKSSTLKMLTRDETITSGKVIIDGRNISTKMTEICQRISYCPPRNPLLEHLTGYEMLALHAHLWGVPKQYIPAYVKNILKALLLDASADELIKYYSDGTKRKLSMGIALLGRPDIILLDKPSAGMDPLARRFLWDTISRTRESGKTIVLISHSVEECESVCSRLAIMVNGKFTCLGSPQELRNKYGNGYSLLTKIKMNKQTEMQELKKFFETTFPDSSLIHEHEGMFHYHIPSKNFTWGKVFGILDSIKDDYGLEDYSVSQITLEPVFLRFAQR